MSQQESEVKTQQESDTEFQLKELTNIDDINAKNFEQFNKESVFNFITDFKCQSKPVKALIAIFHDYEIKQFLMQNDEVDDVDKKKALFSATRAVKKLKKLDKLFSTIQEKDYEKCIQDANKEWSAKAPKKEAKVKTIPKCFKSN